MFFGIAFTVTSFSALSFEIEFNETRVAVANRFEHFGLDVIERVFVDKSRAFGEYRVVLEPRFVLRARNAGFLTRAQRSAERFKEFAQKEFFALR